MAFCRYPGFQWSAPAKGKKSVVQWYDDSAVEEEIDPYTVGYTYTPWDCLNSTNVSVYYDVYVNTPGLIGVLFSSQNHLFNNVVSYTTPTVKMIPQMMAAVNMIPQNDSQSG